MHFVVAGMSVDYTDHGRTKRHHARPRFVDACWVTGGTQKNSPGCQKSRTLDSERIEAVRRYSRDLVEGSVEGMIGKNPQALSWGEVAACF